MTKLLTVDDILNAPDLEERIIEVPEWGGEVKVRDLTKAAQQRIRKQAITVDGAIDPDKLEVLLLAECLVEPKITVEQAEQLKNKSAAAIDRILAGVMNLAGLSEAAQKQALKSFRAGN